MEYIKLGNSDLNVSIKEVWNLGVNFFDTAIGY